jgi:hypothetical protein
MAFDVNTLRSFLVQSPRPTKILVTCGDGETKEILPPKAVGGITWMGLARSIETLDPAKVELFDAADKLIRAQRFDAGALPDVESSLPEILKRDAESARIALFAQLIAGAYKFSVETAFTKMVELTERLDSRLERMEVRLERAETQYRKEMADRINEAFEEADEAQKEAQEAVENPVTGLVQAFVQGAAQGGSQAVPPPNGKKQHP